MGLAVVTVASGGLPVVDVTSIAPRTGTPVTEASNGRGVPVTKVVGKPGMPVVFETIGVAAPVTYVTWANDATAHNVTLSGGNLVAKSASSSNDCGARSSVLRNSGKYYYEITPVTLIGGTANAAGLALASATYADMAGVFTGSTVIVYFTGFIRVDGASSGVSIGARSNGDVIGIAIDLDLRKIWVRVAPLGIWNNNATANPATNVLGITPTAGSLGPACNFGGTGSQANNIISANFGSSPFVGAVPAGFTSGWPA